MNGGGGRERVGRQRLTYRLGDRLRPREGLHVHGVDVKNVARWKETTQSHGQIRNGFYGWTAFKRGGERGCKLGWGLTERQTEEFMHCMVGNMLNTSTNRWFLTFRGACDVRGLNISFMHLFSNCSKFAFESITTFSRCRQVFTMCFFRSLLNCKVRATVFEKVSWWRNKILNTNSRRLLVLKCTVCQFFIQKSISCLFTCVRLKRKFLQWLKLTWCDVSGFCINAG